MKTSLAIATGLLASSFASAALVGTGTDAWSASATAHDAGVAELYSHLLGANNLYLKPDSNENRFAVAGTLGQFNVTGLDSLDLFDLGSRAGNNNYFGIRLYVGADSYELRLTPDSNTGSATMHFSGKINDILVAAGGTALEVEGVNGGLLTQSAKLDFFIHDVTVNNKVFSSGINNTVKDPARPAFNFTSDLLDPVGLSDAKPLPGSKTNAISFLADSGFEVWGLEDSNGIFDAGAKMEPDYNDRIFAFRIVPVPEPSTYGLIGAAALAGIVAARRLRRPAAAKANA